MQLSTLISIIEITFTHSTWFRTTWVVYYFCSSSFVCPFASVQWENPNYNTYKNTRAITRWYNQFKSFTFACWQKSVHRVTSKSLLVDNRHIENGYIYVWNRMFFLDLKCRWFSLITRTEKKEKERCHCEAVECIWIHKRRLPFNETNRIWHILLMRDQCRHKRECEPKVSLTTSEHRSRCQCTNIMKSLTASTIYCILRREKNKCSRVISSRWIHHRQ